MRLAGLATLLAALGAGCTFSAHPADGTQLCSSDPSAPCPDGYSCAADGHCYHAGNLPTVGGAAGTSAGGGGGNGGSSGTGGRVADAGRAGDACTPATIDCGKGAGKRCGKVPDQCGGTVDCAACAAAGEVCQASHVCAPPCGQAAGQACCATGTKCSAAGTTCVGTTCVACGAPGQPCCANDTCTTVGASCADSSSGNGDKVCLLACVTSTGTCISGTDQDCSALCGPDRIGSETCTCASNAWKCLACTFPAGDYSCYKLPATVPACDATTTAGASCALPSCTGTCGSATGRGFLDATGTARSGYCVCLNSRWTCAVTKQWPCPGNSGC